MSRSTLAKPSAGARYGIAANRVGADVVTPDHAGGDVALQQRLLHRGAVEVVVGGDGLVEHLEVAPSTLVELGQFLELDQPVCGHNLSRLEVGTEVVEDEDQVIGGTASQRRNGPWWPGDTRTGASRIAVPTSANDARVPRLVRFEPTKPKPRRPLRRRMKPRAGSSRAAINRRRERYFSANTGGTPASPSSAASSSAWTAVCGAA
jgi:hypothetical protein